MESVTCPHCGAVVRRGNFCSRCSGKLVEVCDCWVKKKAYNCGRDECPGIRLHRLELLELPSQKREEVRTWKQFSSRIATGGTS